MVDEEKIRSNALAREGIKLLAQSGVLTELMGDSLASLVSGDSNEDEQELVSKIREYRRNAGVLLTFQEIGESLIEEGESE